MKLLIRYDTCEYTVYLWEAKGAVREMSVNRRPSEIIELRINCGNV
jgi:hypothetical protein